MDDYPVSGNFETQLQRQEFNPPPMNATLDDEEDVEEADEPDGVMMIYLHAVRTRLQDEVSTQTSTTNWLLPMLKKDDWWLRANRAKEVCSKLNISFSESSYYRDIFVWLPDIRWNTTPPCVECGSNMRVGLHGFRDNHYGVCFSPISENITDKELPKKRGNGQRSVDKKPRKSRTCKSCGSQECPGRGPTWKCNNA